jgi:hypothetical protein
MRKITGKSLGEDGVTDAFSGSAVSESADFMRDLMVLFDKFGLALVSQNTDFEVDLHTPMRIVPLTPEIRDDVEKSWVAFEGVKA